MSNLYELSNEVDSVVREVIDAEGVLSTDLEKRLDEVSLQFKDKSANIGKWLLNIDSNEIIIKKEIDRLTKRLNSQYALRDRLEKYQKFCLENAGLNKIDCNTFVISIEKNPSSVAIDDENEIPEKYIEEEKVKKIKKNEMLGDMRNGIAIRGAHLVTDKTHLRIK